MAKHITITQLSNALQGMAAKNDARFVKKTDKIAKTSLDNDLVTEINDYEGKVDTLIGSDTGKSVREIANDELAEQLIPDNAEEALDTLQEISAWIQSHPDEAAAINSKLTLGTHAVPKYVAATGTYVDGTTYYTDNTGAIEVDTTDFVEGTTDVSEYYVQDGTETVQYATVKAYVEAYIASQISSASLSGSNAIEINAGTISLILDTANANGLAITSSGVKLALATPDTYGGITATGTYVSGTKYYTTSACTTEVDTSEFEVGVTDVSSYYTYGKIADGTAGAFSPADKAKLDSIEIATEADITALVNGLYAS